MSGKKRDPPIGIFSPTRSSSPSKKLKLTQSLIPRSVPDAMPPNDDDAGHLAAIESYLAGRGQTPAPEEVMVAEPPPRSPEEVVDDSDEENADPDPTPTSTFSQQATLRPKLGIRNTPIRVPDKRGGYHSDEEDPMQEPPFNKVKPSVFGHELDSENEDSDDEPIHYSSSSEDEEDNDTAIRRVLGDLTKAGRGIMTADSGDDAADAPDHGGRQNEDSDCDSGEAGARVRAVDTADRADSPRSAHARFGKFLEETMLKIKAEAGMQEMERQVELCVDPELMVNGEL